MVKINFKQIPSPCYILDEYLLRKNLILLDKVQRESGCAIICALKGFAMYSSFSLVKKYLKTCAASSLNEARLTFEEMNCKAYMYSPAYIESEFEELMSYCSHITFNSLNQWNTFKDKVRHVSCGLRINPEYSEVTTAKYNPCLPGSRFGITTDAIGKELPEGIEGLHIHALCENDSFHLERLLKHVEDKIAPLLHQAKWLNLGGGHLITKKGYDITHLIGIIKRLQATYNLSVILEPGSAIAWDTGYLKAKVLDILDNGGVLSAILDISFTCHMPDTLEMPYKPEIRGNSSSKNGKFKYQMGGISCLSGDFIGDYFFASPLKIGDAVIFNDMIHYTMVKTTTFNGVNLPSIGVWKEDGSFCLVKSFGYESYKDRI